MNKEAGLKSIYELRNYKFVIESYQRGYNVVKVVPIQKTGIVRFVYSFNFRIGRRIGRITIKTPKDRSVKIRRLHHIVKLDLVDTWAHKLVIIWKKEDDNCLYYDVVKIRRYIA